jgi:nicotinate-nucleotide adenylyltransferase
MTRLAVRDQPAFSVSTLEARRDGPSFTVDTLRALRRREPRARIYLIMGADSLAEFPGWRDPAAILAFATLAVAARPGVSRAATRSLMRDARIEWLDNPGLDLSSSAIRARLRAGRTVRYLIPDAVARYIARRRLYR